MESTEDKLTKLEEITKNIQKYQELYQEKKQRMEGLRNKIFNKERIKFVRACFYGLDISRLKELCILDESNTLSSKFCKHLNSKVKRIWLYISYHWNKKDKFIKINTIGCYIFFKKSFVFQLGHSNSVKKELFDLSEKEWNIIKKNISLIKKYIPSFIESIIKEIETQILKLDDFYCPWCGNIINSKNNYCHNCDCEKNGNFTNEIETTHRSFIKI